MASVRDAAHLSALISEARQTHGRLCTNCYLLAADIARLTQLERLRYETVSNGLLLIANEAGYDRLYYYLDCGQALHYEPLEQPAVVEILYREATPEAARQAEALWLRTGFQAHKTSREWALHITDVPAAAERCREAETALARRGFRAAAAAINQRPAVEALWRKVLDPFDIPYASAQEWQTRYANEEVLVIVDAAGSVCAALQMRTTGAQSSAWHVAVDMPYRKLGLGTALLWRWLAAAAAGGQRVCFSWIDAENTPSGNLYRKLGLTPSGKTSLQLVRYP